VKVALAAALVAILTGVGTQAAQNGQIGFSRYRFTNSPLREEIWIANPDGTGLKQLTQAPPNFLDSRPDWAPNGSRLVFTRCAPGTASE